MLKTRYFVLAAGLLALASAPAFASLQEVCPILTGGNAGGGGGVSSAYSANVTADLATVANIGCNVLITFNADGSIMTTNPNSATSYDAGDDDNIVGIINNTGSALSQIELKSATEDIFGFDGDGLCTGPTGGWTTGSPSNTAACSSSDSTGYGTGNETFDVLDGSFGAEDGLVQFTTHVAANGGTAYFSLEDPVDINHQIVVTTGVPEPNSLMLLGTGILGLAGAARRKLMA